ncbi:hypothetical protein CEXT_48501 [Caerostris extrusa]|uniref:Uncharacterized protein n=1 Tax=Caerostris extrusa TaxID=172846 RepID=A0AAV4N144_CAEEX|nr:hypothetical protein CEXT_48501 [Caerostris extrusa]
MLARLINGRRPPLAHLFKDAPPRRDEIFPADCFLNQISGGLSAQDWSATEHSISGGIMVQNIGYLKIMVPQGF